MTTQEVAEGPHSSFEKALHSWAVIDLPALQKSLDSQGLEIQEFQKDSLISRKELATKTKSFKRLEAEAKLSEINPLLKSYQNEIDNLTKKNKSIESIFFAIYRAIADAPDPKPLLESAVVAVGSLKEVEALRKENAQLQESLVQYADYGQLKVQLRDMAAQVDRKTENKEKEMQALIDAKETNWREKQAEYEAALAGSKKEVEELKISQQVMQLKLNNQSDAFDDTELNSKATNIIELEMIQRSAESAKARAIQLEKRNEQLTKELTQVQNKEKFNDKINELTAENMRLVARLDHEQSNLNHLRRDNAIKVDSLTVEINQLKHEVESLKERVAKTSDYDELKKELDILKEIEFGALDGEVASENDSNKLDSIMIQTNRKLNNDIVEYRSKHDALNTRLGQLEHQNTELQKQVESLSELNKKLEMDLLNLNGTGLTGATANSNGSVVNGWDNMSVVSTVSKAASTVNGRVSPATSIAGSLIDSHSGNNNGDSGVSNSILPIITQQRDRFRIRNKELEDESKKQFSKIMDLKREVSSLKNDNKELYERIRYISSYSSINQQEKRRNPASTSEFKYEEEYERQLHPIEQFRLKESQRISSKIGPVERIFIGVIRMILSSPLSRYLFAAYCCGLHFVIMILFVYATNLHIAVTPDITEGSTGGIAVGSGADTLGEFVPS